MYVIKSMIMLIRHFYFKVLKVPVSKCLIGHIIGKNGHKIRRIESSSGAIISIVMMDSNPYNNRCKISCNKVQVAKAKKIIEEYFANILASYLMFYLFILGFYLTIYQ